MISNVRQEYASELLRARELEMGQIKFTIDDRELTAEEGTTILEAALQNDIYIPHLCYHPELESAGACRLCTVEVDNGRLVPACRTGIKQGMAVNTRSSEVDRAVRPIVELLIADYHSSCKGCPASGHCALQKIMSHFRIDRGRVRRLRPPQEELPIDETNPCFDYDPNRCIICGICVRSCESTHNNSLLYFIGRGYDTRLGFYGDMSRCESCNICVSRCPVGALIPKREH